MSGNSDDSANRWVEVSASDTLQDGSAIEIVTQGQVIAVVRYQGKLYAMDGMCAHQGGPLAEGMIENGCVTCPWHGWQYELATGIQTINRQPLQQIFEVREQNGRIELRI